ncbi:MAG TPA: MBL fold metallo-hydrolase [Methanocorpusculum sp.]|nr:MBL fold metallo-hydrolase [Methanocorpusculum sp.]
MKLTILAENYTALNKNLLAEPGFSAYIEDGEDKILFDCGYSNVFKKNAEFLHIELGNLTKVVFSHGHDDHTGGLASLLPLVKRGTPLFAHPDTFNIKLRGEMCTGSRFREEDLAKTFSLSLKRGPQKISEHITFLGEIPQTISFETRRQFDEKVTAKGRREPDFVLEDSALVYETETGLYIITGCSHAGICNIIAYAKELFAKPVLGVIGGFHLKEVNEQVKLTIAFFRREGIDEAYPCHCTSFMVRAAFNEAFPVKKEAGVGAEIEW